MGQEITPTALIRMFTDQVSSVSDSINKLAKEVATTNQVMAEFTTKTALNHEHLTEKFIKLDEEVNQLKGSVVEIDKALSRIDGNAQGKKNTTEFTFRFVVPLVKTLFVASIAIAATLATIKGGV